MPLKTITLPGEGENIIDKGAVSNVMIFGDQVDVSICNWKTPALQARKKVEVTHSENPS